MSQRLPFSVRNQFKLIKHNHKLFGLAVLLLALVIPRQSMAEGSKELNSLGGYRAYLNSTSNVQTAAPFPTPGTMRVYVKTGESIYVGSSAQGYGNGTINLRAPNGTTYTSGTSTSVGRITNRNQEMAGPLPNTGGYTPYIRLVGASEEGVWEIDFVAPNAASSTNPTAVLTTANWSQGTAFWICAFDVSVRNVTNTAFLTGRVFTNIFCGNMGNFDMGFNGVFRILTKDGYVYSVNNNGMAGFNFQFFVNNKGFRDPSTLAPTYKSLNTASTTPPVQDPRTPDSGTDITHKIFFNDPAADLPASAASVSGSVWLRNNPTSPVVTTYTFAGREGTSGIGGTNPIGGFINFNANQNGTYSIKIDINRDGDYADAVDRTLTGSSTSGANSVLWDGLDGLGAKVPASTVVIPINVSNVLFGGEVHFPFFDVESNPNGIIITRLTGSGANDVVYWNDSNITNTGTPPSPLSTTAGISSSSNGHKWSNNFGNEKGMDTWAYVLSSALTSSLTFTLREADLEVVNLTPSATSLCTGQSVTYTTQVRNNGPTDISGAAYKFVFPTELTGVNVTSSISGTASIGSAVLTSSQYTATLAMNNAAVITYTFTGTVASVPGSGTMPITSSIMRAADFTDPDATLPDAAAPTDPQIECDAAPSGVGCNNIKSSALTVTLAPTTSNAGPDQTLCAAASAVLAANTATSGTGTWTVVSASAGSPVFASPNSLTSTVSGLTTGTYVFRWSIASGGGCVASTDDVQITVQSALANNVLTTPTTLTFCGSGDPVAIVGSTPTGGSGTYTYQWQSSTDNVSFSNISGATSKDYDPSTLSATTYYRRQVSSGACSTPITSNVITLTIQPVLGSNTLTAPATVTFCTSGDPANIVGAAATGGNGTYTYQWQSSTDNVSFSNITAANSASYDPPAVSVTTYFRRQVTSGACTTPSNSNTITITVSPTLSAGVIGTSQIFCISGNPAAFTVVTAPSGGDGSYTYKWQSSTTSSSVGFTDISGATSATYDAPSVSQTTYYRKLVSSSVCADANSNALTVTVNPALVPGAVAASQSFCTSGDPVAFTETTPASGGDGSFTFQWQSSSDNISFSNVSGATANVYDAPTLSATTYYRRQISSSNCANGFSDTLTVTILPAIGNNTISSNQTICTATSPTTLLGTTPTGGSGGITYLWESSTTGAAGYAAATGTNTGVNYSAGTLTQTTTFRRKVSSGSCSNAISNVITVTVNDNPTTANAGADQGPMNASFATLDGNAASVGVGTWTTVSGPNTPVIQNANLANTNITGLVPGTYTMRWTIANTPCTASNDVVLIRINIAPVANNDNSTFAEDTQSTFFLSTNDTDADGSVDASSIAIVSQPAHGTLVINANGSVRYTPAANYNGADVFTYTINDNLGTTSNTATVNLTITSLNDAPDAQNDQVNTDEDVAINRAAPGVLSNDIDADGDVLTVQLVSNVSHGSLTLNANGSWTYTPTLDYTGFDGFSYRACDGTTCDTAVVTIEVGNVNDVPLAANDNYSVAEDNVLSVAAPGVLLNDFDNDGDVLSATIVSNVSHGTLTFSNTGNFSYTPNSNYNGPESFSYRACDGSGSCDTAVVTITVTSVNDKPIASDIAYTVAEDATLNVPVNGVIGAVSDVDAGTVFTASVYSTASNGTLVLNANGSFTYTPDANFNGVDQFVYQVCDNGSPSLCDTARVTITVTPVNDAPAPVADSYVVAEDGTLIENVPGVLANDVDRDNNPLSAALVIGPTHGTLSLNSNGRFVYTPVANYNGLDQFTYNACDGTTCASAIVTITVTAVNDFPLAGNDSYTVQEDNTLSVTALAGVLNNDSDPDTNSLSAALLAGPSNGTLVFNANGSFTYTPDANFNGSDQFTYTACDALNVCDTATVNIQVNSLNDKPVAVDNSYTLNEDNTLVIAAPGLKANDSDQDGDPLTCARITLPAHGTVTVNPDGSFTYVPNLNYNGTDQFDYRVCDDVSSCDTATVFFTINAVNDTPLAGNVGYTVSEDQSLVVNTPGVLSNSSDADGNPLTAVVTGGPTHGTLVLNSNGSFTYTPDANYSGSDAFTINVCDPFGACSPATISITVNSVNDAPVTVNGNYNVNEDVTLVSLNPGVLTGVTDPDGDAMTASVYTNPKHGTVVMSSAGGFTYTPDPDFNGQDSLIFQVCDVYNVCSFGTSYITVNPINDAPRTSNLSYTIDEDAVLSRAAPGLMFNDFDPENNTMTASLFTAPTHGMIVINPNGGFTYTPDANYNGPDSFVYQNCDNGSPSLCSTQLVNLTITAVNDVPDAVSDTFTIAEDSVLTITPPGLLGNDTDPENNALTSKIYSNPAFGTVVVNPDGSFTYTPSLDYNGTDHFIYESCDGDNACDTATVVINLTPVNDAPRPQDDNYNTAEDVPLIISAPGVLFNDSDPESDPLTAALEVVAVHGVASIAADGSLIYTPATNFVGIDSLYYRVFDNFMTAAVSVVRIVVTPVNDDPAASNDNYTIAEDNTLNVAVKGVLSNDTDTDGDSLTVVGVVTNPGHGTLTLNADGSFSYVPTLNFNGADTFSYRIQDGLGGFDTAFAFITVTSVNDNPTPQGTTYTLNEDTPFSLAAPGLLFNDIDPDSDTLTITAVTVPPVHGIAMVNPDGSFTYTPDPDYTGLDSLTYQESDGKGGTATAVARFIIRPINDAPVAVIDNYTFNEDNTLTIPAGTGLVSNDTDVDLNSLTVSSVIQQPVHGSATVNADGSFTYTPTANFNGSDSLTYIVSDGFGGSDTAVVHFTITPVNDPPIARNDNYNVVTDGTLNINAPGVIFNDSEVDGEALTVTQITGLVGPGGGTLTLNTNGSFTYVAKPASNYVDTFVYVLNDATGNTANAFITFNVGQGNDDPVAVLDLYAIGEDSTLNLAARGVLINDFDVDDTAGVSNISAVLVSPPSHGSISLQPDGAFIYVPDLNYNGQDTFTYAAVDGNGADSIAIVAITINSFNDLPVAVDNALTINEDSTVTFNILTNDFDVDNALDPATVDLIPGGSRDVAVTINNQGTFTIDNAGNLTFTPVANFNGVVTPIQYTVNDAAGGTSNPAFISLFLTPVNDKPFSQPDSFNLSEDGFLVVDAANGVLANDSDVDGDPIISVLNTTSNGTLVFNADGSFSYHPNTNYNGIDFFVYQACDASGECSDPDTVKFSVGPVNDSPLAADDLLSATEDTPANGDVSTNDSDLDLDALTYSVVSQPAHGTLVFNANGTYSYTPSAFFFGSDQFSYQVCDNGSPSLCATAFVNITVGGVNNPPQANLDIYTLDEDIELSVNDIDGVLKNDIDPDGELIISTLVSTSNGLLVLNPNGSFRYTPNQNFNGTDSFTYQACDSSNTCSQATVTLTINSINDRPVASDDAFTIPEDFNVTQANYNVLLANDVDVDGDSLFVTPIGDFTNGVVTPQPGGGFTYTAAANFNGLDSVQYQVCDSAGLCDTAFIRLTITPVNDAPIVVGESYNVGEDIPLNVTAPGLLANDSDIDNDALRTTLITGPQHGTINLTLQGSFDYVPDPDFNGLDSIVYAVCDIANACVNATVYFNVAASNDAPTALADNYTIAEDVVLNQGGSGVLFNDFDKDGNPLTAAVLVGPTSGSLSLSANGNFTYTPNSNFNGIDQFTYTVCDNFSPTACVNQVVTITVTAVNDDPVALGDTLYPTEDQVFTIVPPGLLSNDVDVDGDSLFATVYSSPSHGVLVLNPDGSFTYTPVPNYNGPDQFTYLVCDTNLSCDTAIVYLNVISAGDNPTAVDDNFTILEDGSVSIPSPGVIFNDADIDGDSLVVTILSGPANGAATLSATGGLNYTPSASFNGTDTIYYLLSDLTGGLDTGRIVITVTAVNDNPLANPDFYTVNEDATLTVVASGVLANDSDVDMDLLSVTAVVIQPASGSLTLNSNGSFVYVPVSNFHGLDRFVYRVSDGQGGTDTVSVYITVISVNDAPLAVADTFELNEDENFNAVVPGVLFNDSDDDGDQISASVSVQPIHGTLILNANGGFNYSPDGNYNGTDSFTYLVSDGVGGSTTGTVLLIINPVNDAPVGFNDTYTINEDNTLLVDSASGVLSNDIDVDGDTLQVVQVTTNPLHGSLTQNANGSFTYVPNPNYNGTDSYVYSVADGKGGTSSATVTITVVSVNDLPIARNDLYLVPTSGTLVIGAPGALFNDQDDDGETLLCVAQLNDVTAKGGVITLDANGSFTYVSNPNVNYNDTISYTIRDPQGNTASAFIIILVGVENDPPFATNDTFATAEEVTLNVPARGILANDGDIDDGSRPDNLASILISNPTKGTLSLSTNGAFIYVPLHDSSGTDTFMYRAVDANGASDTATVTITITPVNDAPIAVDDAGTTNEDTPITFAILDNDVDVDGNPDPTTIDLDPATPLVRDGTVTIPGEGTFTVNVLGFVTFTPVSNFHGTSSIKYTVKDGTAPSALTSNQANIVVTVVNANDAPIALPDTFTVAEDANLVVSETSGVLVNDFDPDGEAIVSVLSSPSNGTLTLNSDGSFIYRPTANFSGQDSFTYRACDVHDSCSAATNVLINVTPVNDPPLAVNDSLAAFENQSVNGDVSLNDTDIDNATLTYSLSVGAAHGVVLLNADGTFTYTPTTNYNGQDQFTYTACDAQPLCATAVVVINITEVNQPPVALPDYYTMREDSTLTRTASNGVQLNDVDPDGAISTVLVTLPTHGNVTLNANGSFVYVPDVNYHGQDQFIYRACDLLGACDTAMVRITVTSVNDAPIARDDNFNWAEDTVVTYNALAALVNTNDFDVDGDALTLTFIGGPRHGTNVNNGNGTYTYRPNTNYTGPDSLMYRVCDGSGLCDTAYVKINIVPRNDAPVANPNIYSTPEDTPFSVLAPGVLQNDSDLDGDILISTLVDSAQGTLLFRPDGSFIYTPPIGFSGTDSFIYSACDSRGACDTALVTILVNSVNDAPNAVNDSLVTFVNVQAGGNVLSNDSDPELDALTASLVSGPAHGVLVFNSNGTYTYTPASGYVGSDIFFYQVCDNGSPVLCDTASVSILVNPLVVNLPPVAVNDAYSTPKNTTLTITAPGVLNNDSDEAKALLTLTRITNVLHGNLTLNANGSFTYIPTAGFVGQDSFRYQICDTAGLCDTATVVITINNVNNAPIAVNDNYSVSTNDTLMVINPGILQNDSDPDGQPLAITVLNQPTHGTLQGPTAGGGFTYIPDPNYNGQDSFVYRICDNGTPVLCDSATVYINVIGGNRPPLAVNDTLTLNEDAIIIFTRNDMLSNDSDPDGHALTQTILTQTVHGVLTINGNGTFTYTPNQNFNGQDSFRYAICDNGTPVLCDTATVHIYVLPLNDKPIALDDSYITNENVAFTIPRPSILSNDSDADGDSLTPSLIGNTLHGTLVINPDKSFTYTPNTDYFGKDSVLYSACDPGGLWDTAMIRITINEVIINRPPLPNDDAYQTPINTVLVVPVPGILGNDTDPDGDPLTAVRLTNPSSGSLVQDVNGSFSYTPNTNFIGVDSYTYNACDNYQNCVTRTVTITVFGTPKLGVAKELSTPVLQSDGSYRLTFTIRVRNYGDVALNNVQVTDDLAATFPAPVTFSLIGSPGTTGSLVANASYDGRTSTTLLDGTRGLAINEVQQISFTLKVNLNNAIGPWTNFAFGSAGSVSGPATDFSTNGTNPDPDGNGDPADNSVGTPIIIDQKPVLGIAKSVSAPVRQLDGTYVFNYTFIVKNYGNTSLSNVQVVDDLTKAFQSPAEFSVTSVSATGTLVANNGFNGSGTKELLQSGSFIPAGRTDTIVLGMKVVPDKNVEVYTNSATANATFGSLPISDISTNGLNPDPDGDGVPMESEITPLPLRTDPIFIPGGFSPDGDGINDRFVVENYGGQTINLEMYNRWGNVVYSHPDYQNDWTGKCNTGLYVGDDLPDGTYYYLVKLSGGDQYVGFITINR